MNKYWIRISLITILCFLTLTVKAKRNKFTKEGYLIVNYSTEELRVSIDSVDIDWYSLDIVDEYINIFCGTSKRDSTVYHTRTNLNFKRRIDKELTLKIPFKSSHYTSAAATTYKRYEYLPIFFYNYDCVLDNYINEEEMYDIKYNNSKLSTFFNKDNKIVKIIEKSSNNISVYYTDKRFDKGVVMKVESSDKGATWDYPQIAIKDNILNFVNATIDSDKNGDLYALLQDKKKDIYLSISKDSGTSWSYRKKMSSKLKGTNHVMCFYRSGLHLIFNSSEKEINENSPYIIWAGRINEFKDGANKGSYKNVIEKSVIDEFEVNNVKIRHLSFNEYLISGIVTIYQQKVVVCFTYRGKMFL
ncbi:MAG: exo-alpha-sialidase [Bacteroidetes bacterium]|nr:exo-alpha-sialidase [Bacteroidota bacterium]